jgi:Capsule polysaccharide biosynthesis protein
VTAKVVFHIPERMIDGFANGKVPLLYGAIRDVLAARGLGVDMRPGFNAKAHIPDGDLHIVENGACQKPGVLNAATAYLEGFFHLDPLGIQAASSIGSLRYHADLIDDFKAQTYLAALQARFVVPRHSRYRQTKKHSDLPKGAIAVFLQGPAVLRNGQAYCSFERMLETVCHAAEGRPVMVKAHPLQPDLGAAIIADARAKGHAMIETAANVHDILAACDVTVSVNSAASIEGFLHGKPAVLFGKSDYRQLAQTCFAPEDFRQALAQALANPPDYAKAIYWYFGQNCLDIQSDSFAQRLWAIFDNAGFDANRLR